MKYVVLVALVGCAGDAPPAVSPDAPAQMQATLDCTSYCTRVTANCTGANAQYDSVNTCMGTCAHLPMGALADTSGNTLGCRIYHAGNAAMDPATHCVHAGPSGGGHCGNPCDGFCSIVTGACPAQWPSPADCATTCATFAAMPAYSTAATGGNSLSCRIYHATNAAIDPATHCSHTTATSPVCI